MTAPPEPGWAVEDRLAALWQVDPDPEVATHARTATLAAFTGPSTRRRRLRVPVAVAGCVLVSGVTGAWTAAAASSALPGDTAYGLKRAAAQVQLTAAGLGSLPGTVPGQGHLPTPRPTCPRSSPTRPPPGSIHLFPRAASLRPRSEGPMNPDHPLRPRWNREDPRNHLKVDSLWFTSPVVRVRRSTDAAGGPSVRSSPGRGRCCRHGGHRRRRHGVCRRRRRGDTADRR